MQTILLPRSFLDQPAFRPRVRQRSEARENSLEDRWLGEHRLAEFERAGERGAGPDLEKGPALATSIEVTAHRWGLEVPPAARRHLELLSRGQARVVVTGQQPGFLGGPLYSLFKAATAIALARRLEERDGVPTVPVFWVAGEDHDLDEVRQARFLLDGDSDPRAFRLEIEGDRRPLSRYEVHAGDVPELEELRGHLRPREHGELAVEILEMMTSGVSLAAGFARFLERLLGDRGLLLFDSESSRDRAAGVVGDALRQAPDLLAAIERGREQVKRLGFKPQVAGRFPLFLLDEASPPRRHHLEPVAPEKFLWEGPDREWDLAELLELLERDPARFSPGALLRPLVQARVMPVAAVVGGSAELAYFSQLDPVFELLDVSPSPILPRFHGTVLGPVEHAALERLELGQELAAVLGLARRPEDLVAAEPARQFEDSARQLGDELRAKLEGLVGEHLLPASAPPDQVDRLRRAAEKTAREVEKIGQRGARLIATADSRRLEAARRLWSAIFPGGTLQERVVSTLDVVSRHGVDWLVPWIDELVETVFEPGHRLLDFSAVPPAADP